MSIFLIESSAREECQCSFSLFSVASIVALFLRKSISQFGVSVLLFFFSTDTALGLSEHSEAD